MSEDDTDSTTKADELFGDQKADTSPKKPVRPDTDDFLDRLDEVLENNGKVFPKKEEKER